MLVKISNDRSGLKDRCALITGGTSGIGFCIAKAFLDSGATVIITGRNNEKLKASCEKLADSYKVTEYDTVMNTNLRGVFFLSKLIGKYMKENRIEGNILNIASSSSLRPAVSAYMLSKWGIRGLTLGLARAFAPYGITVNGIAPGPTATPMLLKDNSQGLANDTILGRYALPEEIANMAVFLVSGLGKTIVGDIVYMTGGSALVSFEGIDYSF